MFCGLERSYGKARNIPILQEFFYYWDLKASVMGVFFFKTAVKKHNSSRY